MKQPIVIFLGACVLMLATATVVRAQDSAQQAPDCQLKAIADAQPIELKQYKGKVMYVDFWASWCGPCAKSFPFMNGLDSELKDRGLQIIGINLDENIEDAKQFLEKIPASFTIAADAEEQCAKNFGVKAMPSSYLVDRKGMIRHVHLGFRPGEAEEFRVLVEQLLAENPVSH